MFIKTTNINKYNQIKDSFRISTVNIKDLNRKFKIKFIMINYQNNNRKRAINKNLERYRVIFLKKLILILVIP
jgi:hypothetical protein